MTTYMYAITRNIASAEHFFVCQDGFRCKFRDTVHVTTITPLHYYAWREAPLYMSAMVLLFDGTLRRETSLRDM